MKKLFTLILLALSALFFKADAQTTTCNAEFTWSLINGNTVKFTPATTDSGLVHHEWNFADGTPNSQVVAPIHSYAANGTYAVTHTIIRYTPNGAPLCTQVITHVVTIQQAPPACTLVVDFSWTATAANPLTVQFQNLSVPLELSDSTTWTFGDGTSSYAANPSHTYANAGTYTVCLVVKKNNNTPGTNPCIRYICKTVVVLAPCTLVADFSWNPSTANALMIEFHNLSTPLAAADSTIWSFGDGSSSYAVNPVHTYASAGTYNVCLIVKKFPTPGAAPCVKYICKTIVVQAPPCNFIVDFNWTVAATNPLTLEFHDLTTPVAVGDSVVWSFGDGSSSNLLNPVHTYTNAGTYTVCLTVRRLPASGTQPCVKTICKTVVVQAPPCNLVVDFNWTVTATNPLRLEFHNLSVPLAPTDSTIWTFGDGTTAYDVNPVHTYANAGTYTVCLIVKKYPSPNSAPCVRYICKTIVVTAPCTLVANFTSHPDSSNSQKIWFTNTSVPLAVGDSIRWTFGDGSSSNLVNPDHTYAQPGTYTVCLRVAKPAPAGTQGCVREICKTIVVTPNCNFQVTWNWHLDSANTKKVYFNNTTVVSTASAVVTWTFGDGTSANTWNAVHEYATPGRYYVCLKIQLYNNSCVRYSCDTVVTPVPPPPCNNQSNFDIIRVSTNSQTLTFVPVYQNPAAIYTWTFGDGTGSHDIVSTHHYATGGNYTACLTVWRSATCASTTCRTVQVPTQFNCDSVHVSFAFQRDPLVPNKLYFAASSNYPILDQTWTITHSPNGQPVVLHQNNPSYVFPDTGYYVVCLRAVTTGGCIKEICQTIHITQLGQTNGCTLQAYPNPATSLINVNVPLTAPEMINVYVYNTLNVLVAQKQQQGVIGNNVVTLTIATLVPGFYTMKVVYGTHICYAQFQKL